MDNQNIKVSVICLTYNHEKYIKQCLDGFVMQKTDFAFEVIVHDDASTDNTASIVREYAQKYPDIIKPILQTENQKSKKINVHKAYTMTVARGEYLAFCEGDDCWVDPYKLQKQADALDANPSCKICLGVVDLISESGELIGKTMPAKPMETQILTSKYIIELEMKVHSFQTSSYFFRAAEYKEYIYNTPKFRQVADVGDVPLILYFAYIGDVYYIGEVLSNYRVNSIGSWSHRNNSPELCLKHADHMVQMFEEYDRFTDGRYHELCAERIKEHRIIYLYHSKSFKEILSKENKNAFKKTDWKFKCRTYVGAVCPRLSNFLLKMYRRVKYHE